MFKHRWVNPNYTYSVCAWCVCVCQGQCAPVHTSEREREDERVMVLALFNFNNIYKKFIQWLWALSWFHDTSKLFLLVYFSPLYLFSSLLIFIMWKVYSLHLYCPAHCHRLNYLPLPCSLSLNSHCFLFPWSFFHFIYLALSLYICLILSPILCSLLFSVLALSRREELIKIKWKREYGREQEGEEYWEAIDQERKRKG